MQNNTSTTEVSQLSRFLRKRGLVRIATMGQGEKADHTWYPGAGDMFRIGPQAHQGINMPIYDTVAGTYDEDSYPNYLDGVGLHGVAKICLHEQWHAVLDQEVRPIADGGLGMPDADGDGLCNLREVTLGTDPWINQDSCNLVGHHESYAIYATYGDQELFCRIQQALGSGDESQDWSAPGMQYFVKPQENLQ